MESLFFIQFKTRGYLSIVKNVIMTCLLMKNNKINQ
jgi:hypothetical protein